MSGELYISHPIAVARIVADIGLDEMSLVAALLHDAVEDTEITLSDVETQFGAEVAGLVDGLTKLERLQFDSREAQQAATSLRHTDFITTTDLVANTHDIHPINKRDVGHRFALLALHHDYGFDQLTARGPSYAGHTKADGGIITISFNDAEGLHRRDGQAASGFMLAGADHVFHPAEVQTEDGKVTLRHAEVPNPIAIRYQWHETANPNLYNAAGLPAVPFRTDDWPIITTR